MQCVKLNSLEAASIAEKSPSSSRMSIILQKSAIQTINFPTSCDPRNIDKIEFLPAIHLMASPKVVVFPKPASTTMTQNKRIKRRKLLQKSSYEYCRKARG
jgi:hypothetical protein